MLFRSHITGPTYCCFGLGLGLIFVCQGYGVGMAAMNANALRMLWSAGAGLAAVLWFDLGMTGFSAAVAIGFVIYATLLVYTVFRIQRKTQPPSIKRTSP